MDGRIAVVDDDVVMGEMLAAGLDRFGYRASSWSSADEALVALESGDFDAVVTDLAMRGMSGIELCERIVSNRRDLPVIVVTAHGSMNTVLAALRAGAYDFITKPFEIEVVARTVGRAVQNRRLQQEVKQLRRAVEESQHFEELVGTSPAMVKLYDRLARIADTDSSVLISGESGTGKELVARALHKRSRRGVGPLVAINCAAMPETLLESELFGHAKGAFTDARSGRTGLFIKAHGGTLLLDEIGDMPLGLQPKLLRAIQERTVRPVGAESEIAFDARIIAASNRDLEAAVEKKRFREDLYFRINVIHVDVPPLRARGADVLLLAQHFVDLFAARIGKPVRAISGGVGEKLLNYSWPGNVRELSNCIESAVALTRQEEIAVSDLPEKIRDFRTSHVLVTTDDPSDLVGMDEVERRYIARVLQAVGGNKSQAAKILGFDRKRLYRKLSRHGISTDAVAGADDDSDPAEQ